MTRTEEASAPLAITNSISIERDAEWVLLLLLLLWAGVVLGTSRMTGGW